MLLTNNQNKKIIVQIFTGGFAEKILTFCEIKKKLDLLYKHFHIDGVIIGWSKDQKLYEQMKIYLNKRNTKMFFWFPVFSELEFFGKFQPVVDLYNNKIDNYKLQKGEKFDFYCPTNKENLEKIKNIYENNFCNINFDGVFLDKIRYPSFSNGLKAPFTCFCQDCTKEMMRYGIDVEKLKCEITNIIKKNANETVYNPMGIKKYEKLKYTFENKIWNKFFDFKNIMIYKALSELYKFFKSKGLIVGVDMFAPFLGYFIGQDPKLLVNCVDFIKPMYYRKTWAPAGLLFELEMYAKNFSYEQYDLYQKIKKDIFKVLELNDVKKEVFPVNFVLEELKEFQMLKGRVSLYPGIEVNRKKIIAPVNASYVRENIEMINRSDVEGIILSWDIMSVPDDNLNILYEYLS